MAGNLSDYAEKKLQDHVFGNTAFTPPATVYFGLWTATLDDTSTGATAGEVSGGSYARVAVTNNATNFPAATGVNASKSNANAITFPNPTANWGTVTYVAALDSATLGAGNILAYAALTNSKVVNNGDTPVQFNASAITFTMSGNLSDYLEKKLMDLLFSATAYTAPATIYCGLWNATLDGTSTSATAGEISGNAYARVSITNNTTNFPNASGVTAAKSNGTTISFPTPTPAGWGSVTNVALADVSSGAGNLLLWGALTVSKTINVGDTVQFAASALAWTAD